MIKLNSIHIELNWEDNLGWFEGSVDHEQEGWMFSFELRISVEEFAGKSSSDIWIDDLVVTNPKGKEVEFSVNKVKNALTWE